MALYLWKRHRAPALMGLFAALGMVFASTSSGPILMLLCTLFGVALWKLRKWLRALCWLALMGVITLSMVMKDPVYFLIARIDLTGSSAGWHRAQLIRSALEHLGEWWYAGTDFTRDWMPTGTHANQVHSDMTNHYLQMGVMGGLPLMFVFILVVVVAFRVVGRVLREKNATAQDRFLAWTLGATLFGYVINFFSISLFDESDVFFYLVLGGIGAMQATKWTARGSHDNQPAGGYVRSVGVIPHVSVAYRGKSYL
jgi:hypothetical protein